MSEALLENTETRQPIKDWVQKVTPKIEEVLMANRAKALNPDGDIYSMNLCGEAGNAIPQTELDPLGIEGNKLFGVSANGHNAVHVGYYTKGQNIIIDPTAGQWGDSQGHELTLLTEQYPKLFVGRILVATPEEIERELGWEYRVLE